MAKKKTNLGSASQRAVDLDKMKQAVREVAVESQPAPVRVNSDIPKDQHIEFKFVWTAADVQQRTLVLALVQLLLEDDELKQRAVARAKELERT